MVTRKNRLSRIAAGLVMLLMISAAMADWPPARGALYTSDLGLRTNNNLWSDISISWNVSRSDAEWMTYQYTVTVNVPEGETVLRDLSHFIIEISDSLIARDENGDYLLDVDDNYTPDGDLDLGSFAGPSGSQEVGYFSENGEYPNVSLPGLKIDSVVASSGADSTYYWIFSFDSRRTPMWGSVYLEDGVLPGETLTAWNANYGDLLSGYPVFDDPDWATRSTNLNLGSGDPIYGILVPDTDPFVFVPEPSSALFAGLFGLAGLLGSRTRRHRN